MVRYVFGCEAVLEAEPDAVWQVDRRGGLACVGCQQGDRAAGRPVRAWCPRLAKQRGNLGGPFTITAVDPGRRWVSACPVPLGTITFEHLLEPAAAGYVKVVKRADVQGGTRPLLRLLAPRMRRDTAAFFAALQQRVCHR
jgi:hypothetical protein